MPQATVTTTSSTVTVMSPHGELKISNDEPLTFMLGLNVLDREEVIESTCHVIAHLSDLLREASGRPRVIFKASFDKANRSSKLSPRGPGLHEGLSLLAEIKRRWSLPIMTDVHSPEQVEYAADVVDLIQIPAFLCRQTDLIKAACESGKPLHIKKMQMLAPEEMRAVLFKCRSFGQDQVILCERGTSFGYGHLVVDPLSFHTMKSLGVPVSFDVTHSLQLPGRGSQDRVQAGGRGQLTSALATAGISQGLASLFIECHPKPSEALCDGPCALPLSELEYVVMHMDRLDHYIKQNKPFLSKTASPLSSIRSTQ